MARFDRVAAACAAAAIITAPACWAEAANAGRGPESGQASFSGGAIRLLEKGSPLLKAASARTVASRATATSTVTVYGGFELASTALVYILVRGNSLGTLGVTQGYLDYPRLRLYDAAGNDLAFDNTGRPGFNACTSGGTYSGVVVSYYNTVRAAPTHPDDACTSAVFAPGAYTFSVTPSIAGVNASASSVPTFGEILFEVTLGP